MTSSHGALAGRNNSSMGPRWIDPMTHNTKSRCSTTELHFAPVIQEGNVLFNDALNIFCLRLYGVVHMVKDHSDSERGNPLPPHRLLFPISSKGSFICIIPQTGYHGLCYTSRGALTGTRNSSMGPPHEGLIRRPIAPSCDSDSKR